MQITNSVVCDTRKGSLYTLWNNSLISISILRDYWLETMRDGHKRLLIYLDFPPEAWGWFVFTVQRLVFVFNLKNSFVNILNIYIRTMKITNDA